MPTPKRSALDEAPLANMVEDVTEPSARLAGGVATDADKEALALERSQKIELLMKEHGVPKPIAEIIADTGYSKGTANRIYNDTQKRLRAEREAKASKGAKATASATA